MWPNGSFNGETMPFSDRELIDEALDGSRSAYEQLIRRHQNLVYRIAYSYVGNSESSCDISQNVFLKVYRKLQSFGGQSTFRTWVTRIAMNESLNWVRAQRRHEGHVELTGENSPHFSATQEKSLLQRESRDSLLHEIHRLNPRQSRAVQLRYFEEMPVREIAAVLDCSEGQVKNILFRSLQVLRRRMVRSSGGNEEMRR